MLKTLRLADVNSDNQLRALSISILVTLFTDTERSQAAGMSLKGLKLCKNAGLEQNALVLAKQYLGIDKAEYEDIAQVVNIVKNLESRICEQRDGCWAMAKEWLVI